MPPPRAPAPVVPLGRATRCAGASGGRTPPASDGARHRPLRRRILPGHPAGATSVRPTDRHIRVSLSPAGTLTERRAFRSLLRRVNACRLTPPRRPLREAPAVLNPKFMRSSRWNSGARECSAATFPTYCSLTPPSPNPTINQAAAARAFSIFSTTARVARFSTRRSVGAPFGRTSLAARLSHSKRSVAMERRRKSVVLFAVRGFSVAVVAS
jgi:hypothetical protein